MIRLHKDAPWNEVEIREIKINKTDWLSEDTYYDPVKKWIIHEDIHVDPIPVEESTIDYSKLTKTELIKACEEKSIDSKGLTKAQLIEKLTSLN